MSVAQGEAITLRDGALQVPSHPVVPFIEGDGTGPDIWRASVRVLDAAVAKAYGGKRKIAWMEVLAGQKAFDTTGSWLPQETVDAFEKYLVGIKGPLTTPIGGGIRSLNVALRQMLDLYVCLRPVRWFQGVPSPVKRPEKIDIVIFRENTEDIYAGIEFQEGTEDVKKVLSFLRENFPSMHKKIRFPETAGIGFKPVSREGTERLVRAAIEYAIRNKRKSVTLVHKGNIMKFTEGAFRNWGYSVAEREFGEKTYTWDRWEKTKAERGEKAANEEQKAALDSGKVLIKDTIADIFLQQILTRPDEFDVVATLNLNGDYASDALAAQVGGIGIARAERLQVPLHAHEVARHHHHRVEPRRAPAQKIHDERPAEADLPAFVHTVVVPTHAERVGLAPRAQGVARSASVVHLLRTDEAHVANDEERLREGHGNVGGGQGRGRRDARRRGGEGMRRAPDPLGHEGQRNRLRRTGGGVVAAATGGRQEERGAEERRDDRMSLENAQRI